MSVTLHLLAPSSFGLYHQAVIESNPAAFNYRTPEQSYMYADKLAEQLGCSMDDTNCLRNQSASAIVTGEANCRSLFVPLNTTIVLQFYPNIDGVIIPDQPMEMLKRGQVNPNVTAVCVGSNRNDSTPFIPDGFISKDEYEVLVGLFFAGNTSLVLEQYPPVPHKDNSNLVSSGR